MNAVGVTFELSPTKIFAGRGFTLTCRVECSPPCDLHGRIIHIKSDEGNVLHSATLGAFDGVANECSTCSLTAPRAEGLCTWSIELQDAGENGGSPGAVLQPVTFEVLPHQMSVLLWGLKSAVAIGEEFVVVVALRCGCRCPMSNQKVTVVDHLGHRINEVTMSEIIWPGSEAVYFAKLPLVAPAREGRLTWQLSAIAAVGGVAHSGQVELELLASRPLDCTVTVTTLDVDDRMPLSRATVSTHPLSTLPDENDAGGKAPISRGIVSAA